MAAAAAPAATGTRPVVIMVGDCGTGKSTAVEKMTGVPGLAGHGSTSHTRHQNRLPSRCNNFIVVDTPGGNPMEGELEDNMEMVKALNSEAVSLLLCSAKAQVRIEQMVRQVEEYFERFIDFSELVCFLITHMDEVKVQWTQEALQQKFKTHFGGTVKVVFSGKHTSSDQLCADVGSKLAAPRRFDIDSSNFLHYFRICKKHKDVLKAIRDMVRLYKRDVKGFQDQLSQWPEADLPDQCFQFNSFMTNRIPELQGALAERFGWDMQTAKAVCEDDDDPDVMEADQQIGYVAYLSSLLRAELFPIRTLLCNYHVDAEASNLRKCPHCGTIWGKWEGCDGTTTCGARPYHKKDWKNNQQAGFTFTPESQPYQVVKNRVEQRGVNSGASGFGAGCGATITWSTMQPVTEGTNASGDSWTLAQMTGQTELRPNFSLMSATTAAGRVSFEHMFEVAKRKSERCSPQILGGIMNS